MVLRKKLLIVVALLLPLLTFTLGRSATLYDRTVRVVSSTGTVLSGVASAVSAPYDMTVRIVDSNGLVIDSFGSGTTNKGLTNNGGTAQVGSTVITGIGQPSAPVVTPNTTGTTTATYYCDALDINGLTNLTGGIGNTIPSAGTTITNGAVTPNTTIKCGGQTGAQGYVVTKGATGGATNFLGSCLTLGSGNACSVTDTGQALTTYTANSVDKTSFVGVTYLGAPNGNPVTLIPNSNGDGSIILPNGGWRIGNAGNGNGGFVVSDPNGLGYDPIQAFDGQLILGNPTSSSNAVATIALKSHTGFSLTAPSTLTNCGTGAVVAAGSSDDNGSLTVGTTPGSCVMNFAQAFTTAPVAPICVDRTAKTVISCTASTTALTFGTVTASDAINWWLTGN